MKSNNGILTEKEIQARTKFWNKKNLSKPLKTCKIFW